MTGGAKRTREGSVWFVVGFVAGVREKGGLRLDRSESGICRFFGQKGHFGGLAKVEMYKFSWGRSEGFTTARGTGKIFPVSLDTEREKCYNKRVKSGPKSRLAKQVLGGP